MLASFTSMQLESDSTILGNPKWFNQPGKCSRWPAARRAIAPWLP